MSSQPMPTHITVVNLAPAAAGKAGPASAASEAVPADFARLLARQLGAGPGPEILVDTPSARGEPVSEETPRAAVEPTAAADPPFALAVALSVPVAPVDASPRTASADDGRRAAPVAQPPLLPEGVATPPANFAADFGRLPERVSPGQAPQIVPALEAKTKPKGEAGAPFLLPAGGEAAPQPPVLAAHGAPARVDAAGTPPASPGALQTPLGGAGWGTELGQKVVWLVQNQQQTAHISVTPPQLGPVEIRLDLSQDQASMTFVSPHAPVRDAIEAALPRLREMLAEHGLSLGNVDVSAQSFGHGRPETGRPHTPGDAAAVAGSPPPAGLALRPAGLITGREGMVDTFA